MKRNYAVKKANKISTKANNRKCACYNLESMLQCLIFIHISFSLLLLMVDTRMATKTRMSCWLSVSNVVEKVFKKQLNIQKTWKKMMFILQKYKTTTKQYFFEWQGLKLLNNYTWSHENERKKMWAWCKIDGLVCFGECCSQAVISHKNFQ